MRSDRSKTRPPRATSRLDAVRRIDAAFDERAPLLARADTTVCRVFNGAADGIDGLVIEKLGDVLVAQIHSGRLRLAESDVRDLAEKVRRRLSARAVYRKVFAPDRSAALPRVERLHTDPNPWLGTAVEREFPVLERGVRFLVRPYDGYSVGLFLEQRENRKRVREIAAGRRVLNAFAYTCGFSVAAALGGAAETASVDVSRKHLEWGKRNFGVNGLELHRHRFFCSDVLEFFRRAARQRRRFDLIIVDPPTFARGKRPKRVFVLADDLDRLVRDAAELLSAGGQLLLATNHRKTSLKRLEGAVAAAAGARSWAVVARPRLPLDFRGDPGYAKSLLVRIDQ